MIEKEKEKQKVEDEEIVRFLESPKQASEIVNNFTPRMSERTIYNRMEGLRKRGEIKKLPDGRWVVFNYKETPSSIIEKKICSLYNFEVTLLLRKISQDVDSIRKSELRISQDVDSIRKSELRTIVEALRKLNIGLFDGGLLYSDEDVKIEDRCGKAKPHLTTSNNKNKNFEGLTLEHKVQEHEVHFSEFCEFDEEKIALLERIDKLEEEKIALQKRIYELKLQGRFDDEIKLIGQKYIDKLEEEKMALQKRIYELEEIDMKLSDILDEEIALQEGIDEFENEEIALQEGIDEFENEEIALQEGIDEF